MEKLRQNKVSMKKALAAQSYMPCRAVVNNVTFSKEFHFATDARLGPSAHHAISEDKGNDFVGSLRQHPPSPVSIGCIPFVQCKIMRKQGFLFIGAFND